MFRNATGVFILRVSFVVHLNSLPFSFCPDSCLCLETWKFPEDFQLLSSKDQPEKFTNYQCQKLRNETFFQTSKYFCSKKRDLQPPMYIVDNVIKGFNCTALFESGDLTYTTRHLCIPPTMKAQFKWEYIKFHGFEYTRCIGFNAWRMWGDMWANNYLCADKPVTIEVERCDD